MHGNGGPGVQIVHRTAIHPYYVHEAIVFYQLTLPIFFRSLRGSSEPAFAKCINTAPESAERGD